MLLLRDDLERTLAPEQTRQILKECEKIFGTDIKISDIHGKEDIPREKREQKLKEKFEELGCRKLVITDRLHGMIFAALTETSCIVLDSKSPKVRGCYEWIRDLGYIAFVDSPEQIPSTYERLKNLTPQYNHNAICEKMKEMEADVLHIIGRKC